MSAPAIKVAVLSPQSVVREGLIAILGRHPDRVELIALPVDFGDVEPDVVLYDVVGLHDSDGADFDELVKRTAAVVFAVGRELRPELLTLALERGADGFFDLGVSEPDLLAAVESAVTGWQVGDPGADPVVGSRTSEARARHLGHDVGLSARERRVLALIAQGLSNDEIAVRDYLSVNTIKTYIRTAYRKIGATNRTEAGIWAVQHGFTSEEDDSTFHDDR